MYLIITLGLYLLISFLFTLLARKLKIPVVIGLIFAGILLGSPMLRMILLGANEDVILGLGDIGLIVLMFLAGLEISWSMLYQEKRESLYLASFAFVIPFLLGFFLFFFAGFPVITALIIGIAMSITAEATKARVLLELGKLKTKLGSLMMGAGIIDDIFGIILLLLVSFMFLQNIPLKEMIILVGTILAFFIGILVHQFMRKKTLRISYLEHALLNLVVPFFFISMGMHFNLQSLTLNPWLLLGIIGVAITGKMIGTMFLKFFTKFTFKQLYLVGWGMNSRGAVELAIIFIAVQVGLINTEIYSSLVIMTFVTTLIFPFVLKRLIQKNPGIMN